MRVKDLTLRLSLSLSCRETFILHKQSPISRLYVVDDVVSLLLSLRVVDPCLGQSKLRARCDRCDAREISD